MRSSPLANSGGKSDAHKMALSLVTLMLGSALPPKPRASERDATAMIRSLGFGLESNTEPVDSEAVKLIKRGPEYGHLTRDFSGVSDAIDEALVTLEHGGYIALAVVSEPEPSAVNTLARPSLTLSARICRLA